MKTTNDVYNDFDDKTTGLIFNITKVNSLLNNSTTIGEQKVPSAVEAAKQVNSGLQTLATGTPALADGIDQVAEGAAELNEGVNGKDGLVSQVSLRVARHSC